jgi:hypothetical protein
MAGTEVIAPAMKHASTIAWSAIRCPLPESVSRSVTVPVTCVTKRRLARNAPALAAWAAYGEHHPAERVARGEDRLMRVRRERLVHPCLDARAAFSREDARTRADTCACDGAARRLKGIGLASQAAGQSGSGSSKRGR